MSDKRIFDDADFESLRPGTRSYEPPKPRDTGTVEIKEDETFTSGGFRIPPAGRDAAASRKIRTSRYSTGYRPAPVREKSTVSVSVLEYDAAGPQITHVSVRSWPNGYTFYEKFVRDAHVSHTRRGGEAPHVPFFSYIPQYSQLSGAQWAYYLYMKSSLEAGAALREADFSYVVLYLYEIINLEGVFSPAEGAEKLAAAWLAYRSIHPMLDKYMSEWMADYCLIYGIPLPDPLIPVIPDAVSRSTVKEFYADAAEKAGLGMGPIYRLALSDYNPMRSRFAKDDESFARETEKVFDAVVTEKLARGGLFGEIARETTVTRDAFCGSLCSSSVKKRITLTLKTYMRSPEARRVVTEMFKSSENVVRARRGIKSRLSAPQIEGVAAAAKSEEEAKYLAFYDAPGTPLSAEKATEIETESWRNAEILTDGEVAADEVWTDDEVPCGALTTEMEESVPDETEEREDGLDAELKGALLAVLNGESFTAYCREHGMFADDAAAKINDFALERIGDVVLEKNGTDHTFIEDYRKDIGGELEY